MASSAVEVPPSSMNAEQQNLESSHILTNSQTNKPKEVTVASVVKSSSKDNSKDKKVENTTEDAANGSKAKDAAKQPPKEPTKPPKIFDNKNFVEAPIPKTNPWGKAAPPPAQPIKAAPPPPEPVVKKVERKGKYNHLLKCLASTTIYFILN